MIPPPLPHDEPERLASLRALGLLDTAAEERFDRITRLAQALFDVPITLISLVDADRQWFKSRQGLEADHTSRDVSFCAHAILGSEVMEVPDATRDERFQGNSLVEGPPDVRFYAGVPLNAPDGRKIGTLCLIDRKPRVLTETQRAVLKELGEFVDREIAETSRVRVSGSSAAASAEAARRRGARDWWLSAGFAAAVVIMLGAAAASYIAVKGVMETSRWVTRTHKVLENLAGVVGRAQNEQAAARGYVITGDSTYSRLFQNESRGMTEQLAALRVLVSDHKDQLKRLDAVDRLAARRGALAASVIDLRRRSGFKAAAAFVRSGVPQRAMDVLIAAIGEMDAEERRLLAEHEKRVGDNARFLILVAAFARVVGVLVVLLAFLAVRRYIAERATAEDALVLTRDAALRDADAVRQAQEEARRVSDRLRSVLDQIDSGVMLVDATGGVSIFNPAAERIHGAWRDDIARLMREGTHPPMRVDEKTPLTPDEDPMTQALKGTAVFDTRIFLRTPFRPNGYYLSASAAPLRSHQGLVSGAVLVFRDITETVRAERRQALQFEAIRLLAETRTGEDPIPGLLRIIGEKLGWVYGGYWKPDASGQALRAGAHWAAAGAKLEAFESVSAATSFEPGVGLPGRAWKERRPIWIKDVVSAQNFPRGEAAESAGLHGAVAFPLLAGERCLGVVEFLSARVEEADPEVMTLGASLGAQIALFLDGRQAEIERTRFFNLSLDLLCVAGFDGYFKILNSGWEKTLGWTKEELMAVPYFDFVHPEDRQLTLSEAGLIAAGSKTLQFDNRYRCKDGSYKWLSWTSTPVLAEGVIYAAARDVTERRRVAEELAEARDAALSAAKFKSDFLANMSHEIRTPMNAVIGMTGLLLDSPLTPQQRDYIETVREAGDALLTLINDILDYSKIEAGKMRLESVDFSLRETLERSVELVAQRAQQKGLELTVSVSPSVPAALRGDAGRLRQVMLNLLGNAVKFTEKGEISVTAEAVPAGALSLVTLVVRDTGIGIPSDVKERLFQSFSQGDASTTRKYGGTGLGLAISRQLAELMGGRIGVDSEPGGGSRFWIEIPFAPGVEPKETPRAELPELSSIRAIVVDDNATNREIVRAQLAGWNMVCDSARGAKEGLEMMLRAAKDGRPYGLAILDLQMPEEDGLSLSAKIKGAAALGRPPVILMTSMGNVLDAAAMSAAGLSVCLSKPVRHSALFDSLATALAARGSGLPAPAPAVQAPAEHLRVLIVEDNSVNQKVILLQLRKLGHSADAVASGKEALESLEKIRYDQVLMDCQMPEMDGYEATREIRRREAADGKPRILITALTANVMPEDKQKCFDAGMDGYLSKPVRLEELERALSARPAPAVKGATIEELREMAGAEGFRQIRDEFLHSGEILLADLRRAAAAGDAEALRRGAHTLKGASGSLGATGLESMCRQLEADLAEGKDVPSLIDMTARMTGEFAAVKLALEKA
jgi:two-component system sensor histidine kinase/response regulator